MSISIDEQQIQIKPFLALKNFQLLPIQIGAKFAEKGFDLASLKKKYPELSKDLEEIDRLKKENASKK